MTHGQMDEYDTQLQAKRAREETGAAARQRPAPADPTEVLPPGWAADPAMQPESGLFQPSRPPKQQKQIQPEPAAKKPPRTNRPLCEDCKTVSANYSLPRSWPGDNPRKRWCGGCGAKHGAVLLGAATPTAAETIAQPPPTLPPALPQQAQPMPAHEKPIRRSGSGARLCEDCGTVSANYALPAQPGVTPRKRWCGSCGEKYGAINRTTGATFKRAKLETAAKWKSQQTPKVVQQTPSAWEDRQQTPKTEQHIRRSENGHRLCEDCGTVTANYALLAQPGVTPRKRWCGGCGAKHGAFNPTSGARAGSRAAPAGGSRPGEPGSRQRAGVRGEPTEPAEPPRAPGQPAAQRPRASPEGGPGPRLPRASPEAEDAAAKAGLDEGLLVIAPSEFSFIRRIPIGATNSSDE
jgi:DNA-directed RNA polymerase subunit M/transcription elongation factor TFIIS